MGYATKLDTNGLRPDVLKAVLDDKLVDYVAMDVKNSPEKYAHTVGVQNVDMVKILGSIQLLKDSGIDFEFRTTLIKEFHTADDVQKIAYLVSGAPRYFMQKYNDNDGCIAHGYTPVPKADAESYKEYFAGKVGIVSLRGYK